MKIIQFLCTYVKVLNWITRSSCARHESRVFTLQPAVQTLKALPLYLQTLTLTSWQICKHNLYSSDVPRPESHISGTWLHERESDLCPSFSMAFFWIGNHTGHIHLLPKIDRIRSSFYPNKCRAGLNWKLKYLFNLPTRFLSLAREGVLNTCEKHNWFFVTDAILSPLILPIFYEDVPKNTK